MPLSDEQLELRRLWFANGRDLSGAYGRDLVAEVKRLRAPLAAVEALQPTVDGSGGKAWVVAWGDLRAALASEGGDHAAE